jgi:alkanesulfonate monooxygenase SsuD/methylene tetrahydromethanopterin reductase-like flavin-dependent oxidoreductase (luciferase family)
LAGKIERYRKALCDSYGPEATGKVSLMLHTFLGPDLEAVKDTVRTPFREYLRSAISLEQLAAGGGGSISGGHRIEPHRIPADAMEELLTLVFERYFATGSLMGPPARCLRTVERLEEIGVDEIACLIDFVDDPEAVLESLGYLCELCAACAASRASSSLDGTLAHFLEDVET